VKDGSGRTGLAIRNVTVSNTSGGLTVSMTQPTNDTTVSGTPNAIVWVSGAGAGSKTYTLTADGQTVATMQTASTSAVTIPWNTRSVADGSRVLEMSVRDAAGKTGSTSATVTVANGTATPPPNSEPPTGGGLAVSVTQPTNGVTVSGTHNAIVWVNGAAAGSKDYTLSAGGQTVATMQTTSTGPVTIPWNTRSVADGSQVLTASVRDAAGKTGSRGVTVTVRNGTASLPGAPNSAGGGLTVWVTEPTSGETVSGTHWAVVWVNGAADGWKTFTLSVAGQTVGTLTSTSSGPVSIPWTTKSVADGSRALTATVRDPAGKTGSTSVTVTVRNGTTATPPPAAGTLSLSITQPQNTRIVNGTTSVVVWAEGTNGASNTFTLAVDGVTVGTQTVAVRGPVTIPWNTTSKANGTRTLTATVRDATGRTASTTITAVVKN
jgi:hypothetical protein